MRVCECVGVGVREWGSLCVLGGEQGFDVVGEGLGHAAVVAAMEVGRGEEVLHGQGVG